MVIISAYAPTLKVSNKQPEKREDFYQDLGSIIRTVNVRGILIVGGDFNAKTDSAYKDFKNEMGRFAKGEANENGHELLEFCARNNLILKNTKFQHQMKNRTTWQAPENRNQNDANGEIRRHPIRNQIDYIIVRKKDFSKILDSRSYSGTETRSDHRLILTTVNDVIPVKRHNEVRDFTAELISEVCKDVRTEPVLPRHHWRRISAFFVHHR